MKKYNGAIVILKKVIIGVTDLEVESLSKENVLRSLKRGGCLVSDDCYIEYVDVLDIKDLYLYSEE